MQRTRSASVAAKQSEQAATFCFQCCDDESQRRFRHLFKIFPATTTGRAEIGCVWHTERVHLLMQPIVTAIPRVVGINGEENVRRIVSGVQMEDCRILPTLLLAA